MMVPQRAVIAGNWKMNLEPQEVSTFFRGFHPDLTRGRAPEILFFPTALSLHAAVGALEGRPDIGLGVQNIHWKSSGAFTGEISAGMAKAAGATHVLIGHSERRHLFGETDDQVYRKAVAAFGAGLVPVICVGETLEERRRGFLKEVILRQLDAVIPALSAASERRAMVAYEPVWAIGTGETATPEDASEAHTVLRHHLVEALGKARGDGIPILYGGSVKPANAAELLGAPQVGGVLVGGASLDPEAFARIAEAGVRGSGPQDGDEKDDGSRVPSR